MKQEDSESSDDEKAESKQAENLRINQETLKRASLESSLGQYGSAAVKDLESVFKPTKR